MHSLALLVAAASLGVDYGWQPADDGQLEYIIQIEPSLVELLRQGQEIVSEIHPDAKGVRRFRILIGKGELPRENPPQAAADRAPAAEPEIPAGRPPVRAVVGAPRGDFQPEIEPGPAGEEPAEAPPAPARRRLGGEFSLPAVPDEEPSFDPLQPDPLEPDPAVEPLKHRQVGHTEQLSSRAEPTKPAAARSGGRDRVEAVAGAAPAKSEPARPWLPLAVTALLLFGSLGGNAYLAWLAKDFYSRYRALTEELRGPRPVEA